MTIWYRYRTADERRAYDKAHPQTFASLSFSDRESLLQDYRASHRIDTYPVTGRCFWPRY